MSLLPCNACLTLIARYGIKRIVYKDVYDKDATTLKLAKEFGIELVQMQIDNRYHYRYMKVPWWKKILVFLGW